MTATPELTLKPPFTYAELFHAEGLRRLDEAFLTTLQASRPTWHDELIAYRAGKKAFSPTEISTLLLACAPTLETFLAALFAIEEAVAISQARTTAMNPLSTFKKYFVLRRAKKELHRATLFPSFQELSIWLEQALAHAPLQATDQELAIALLGHHYLSQPDFYAAEIDQLVQWCVQALTSPEGQRLIAHWTSFHLPQRLDYSHLISPIAQDASACLTLPDDALKQRDGFTLTDPRMSARQIQDEVNYCIYCHDHEGDFCSKGFPVKKQDKTQGFKKNPLDTLMTGCPLEEKISEMHLLKQAGYTLAALAMVMVDNPMCPATGHRICNDCMKACIYQKQTPVNIPQIETAILTDVLALPWGVEIYDLLTRWNPLRQTQWTMQPYNGLKVMIAGMGPAGFTLAHHLLQEGFAIVGFDGLKIEPLPPSWITAPIYQFADLKEALNERLMAGFGGVAEYGITVRWDKNFLKLIYLSLMRRPYFQVFGSVRFGGTITVKEAWKMGFDHFVIAVGAGLPKALPIPHSLAPGMRQANDFLMALQLGHAAKASSLTNLQIRLPAVIIGSGLTGIDTATEVQAYYITQVEKILYRYEHLIAQKGEAHIQQSLDTVSKEILAEYLRHAQAIRQERQRAQQQGDQPQFTSLIREWGGVTIAYRRSMQESPAYIHNHEELRNALAEGVYYREGLEPTAVDLNEYGHVEALICHRRLRNEANEWITTMEEVRLLARSILVATGTQPNTAYEFEHHGTFNRLHLQYQHYEEIEGELVAAHGVQHCKDPQFGPFTSYAHHQRVSLIGDTHPVFHGSVVKAIASGMRTYPKILQTLKNKRGQRGCPQEYQAFAQQMHHLFHATVVAISRQTKKIIELTIHAPLAARQFKPGQFYRLQNFETHAPRIDHTLLQMEPLAVIPADCHPAAGTLTFIIPEHNAAAKICSTFKPGDAVALMGPTGVRAKIPTAHETILIMGHQSSFAFLRSYGTALRAAGNHVIYLGLFHDKEEVYSQEKLEQATDVIGWGTRTGPCITTNRPTDLAFISHHLTESLQYYSTHQPLFPLADVDRIFIIGPPTVLRDFQTARQTLCQHYFPKDPKIFGAVYGNMQCMLKGVCAQCLQWQIDPETKQRTKAVFACSWQDQPLELIDIGHMEDRAAQNRLHDQLSSLWVDYLFEHYHISHI